MKPQARIRRIQRLLKLLPCERGSNVDNRFQHVHRQEHLWEKCGSAIQWMRYEKRTERCGELFAAELTWLCDYAFAAWDMVDQLDVFANNIQLEIGRERYRNGEQ